MPEIDIVPTVAPSGDAIPSTPTTSAGTPSTRITIISGVDPDATNEPPNNSNSRIHTWSGIVMSRINRLIMILTYPFVVVFTVGSLLVVLTFCVFPTLICMTLGVCIYYCLMDDPIPLSVLLRYMLSPDPDDINHPHPAPYSQSRGSIQAKLIIRKVLRIEDIRKENEGDDPENDATKNQKTKEDEEPRWHPFPIQVKAGDKCLYFSEPILYDEKEDEPSSSKEGKDAENRIPLYQQSGNVANNGGGNGPADEENALDDLSVALAAPLDDNELGLVEIAIGASYDSEENRLATTTSAACEPEEPSLSESKDLAPVDETSPLPDPNDDQSCSHENEIDHESASATTKPAASKTAESLAIAATEQLEEVMELVEDYFGIPNASARERGTACDICLLDFEVGEEVAWSPNTDCIHSFHKDCVLDWLIRKPSCPSCRTNYLESKTNRDENV